MTSESLMQMLGRRQLIEDDRNLLGQSTLYCCCGKDPTPILEFGDRCPLYIYVDSMMLHDFFSEKDTLYKRLEEHGFRLREASPTGPCHRLRRAERAEISCWESPAGKNFGLIFIECDAETAFYSVYDDSKGIIMPECLCNCRSEAAFKNLPAISKRIEYIMGHCRDDIHVPVKKCDYYGDYGSDDGKVTLFRRFYYYY